MPLFIAAFLGGLITVAGSMAGSVLLSLGIMAVTYTGIDTSLTWLKTAAVSALSGLPSEAVGMLATMKVGTAISIISSAMVARMVLSGLTSGTVKRWVTK